MEQHNGVDIIEVEQGAAMAWLGVTHGGKPVRTKLADTLHLADGNTFYRCALDPDCTYTAASVQMITASHGPKAHGTGKGGFDARRKTIKARNEILDMSVRDFIAWAQGANELLEDAEDLRNRAMAAERRLAAIERHFQ